MTLTNSDTGRQPDTNSYSHNDAHFYANGHYHRDSNPLCNDVSNLYSDAGSAHSNSGTTDPDPGAANAGAADTAAAGK